MENSPRLCDILNLQANKINFNDLEKTNSAWELIKQLFMDNVSSLDTTEVYFVVQNNEKIFFSINEGPEHEVQLLESDLLSCIDIAQVHGLTVIKVSAKDSESEDDPKYFIYFTFNPERI